MTRIPGIHGKVRTRIASAAAAYAVADSLGYDTSSAAVASTTAGILGGVSSAMSIAQSLGFSMGSDGTPASSGPSDVSSPTLKTWNLGDSAEPCDICEALDGVTVGADETFDGLDGPPAHPNCACTMEDSTPS